MTRFVICIALFWAHSISGISQGHTVDVDIALRCPKQPEDGVWKCFYSNGQLHREYNFQEGKMHGVQRSYYPTGQLKSEANYAVGRKNGAYISWDDSGCRISATNWSKGFKEGAQMYWHCSGGLKRKEYYKAGKKTGIWLEWHDNGQLKSKIQYSGWQVVKDFGYWNYMGYEITNSIDRLIDSEGLQSDTCKSLFAKFEQKSKLLVERLISQNEIDSIQGVFFRKIIEARKLQAAERIESLNYDYLILKEEFDMTDSSVSVFETYCFPPERNEVEQRGFAFDNNERIGWFFPSDCDAYVSDFWTFGEFERLPPNTRYFPMGCISPAPRKIRRAFLKYRAEVQDEGDVVDPYFKILTLFNGRTGEMHVSIQVPERGKRKVEKRYGPY